MCTCKRTTIIRITWRTNDNESKSFNQQHEREREIEKTNASQPSASPERVGVVREYAATKKNYGYKNKGTHFKEFNTITLWKMYICVLSAGTVLYKSCFRYLCWPVHLKSCAQWHTSPWIFIYIFCHGCDAFNESSIWISRIFFSSSECVVDGCRCWCCCCFCNNSNKKHLAVFYYITMNRRFHSPQIRFCYNDTRVE